MGKLARELAAAPDENLAPAGVRRPFKAEEWPLQQDVGDFINIKTGEILEPEELERLARSSTVDDPAPGNPFDDDEFSQVARPRSGKRR